MKSKQLQMTLQRYNESEETMMSNCMPIEWTARKKWTNYYKGTVSQG